MSCLFLRGLVETGCEQEMNESMVSRPKIDKTGFYGASNSGTGGFGLNREQSVGSSQKPKEKVRSVSPTKLNLLMGQNEKQRGTFAKQKRDFDYDTKTPGPGAYLAEKYEKHGVVKTVFNAHEPEKLIMRQSNIPNTASIYKSHYMESKDAQKLKKSYEF